MLCLCENFVSKSQKIAEMWIWRNLCGFIALGTGFDLTLWAVPCFVKQSLNLRPVGVEFAAHAAPQGNPRSGT